MYLIQFLKYIIYWFNNLQIYLNVKSILNECYKKKTGINWIHF